MRAILIVVILAAAGMAGWSALTALAPRMQADIDARANAAIRDIAKHAVEIQTDGRHITLTGIADNADERDRLISALRSVDGQVAVADRLRVLETISPYTLRAWQGPDGRIAITGVVPSRSAEEVIRDHAAGLAGDADVEVSVSLASGIPDDAWIGMVKAGLSAMVELEGGAIRLSDREAVVSGLSDGISARDGAIAALSQDRYGNWQTRIEIKLPVARPYRFFAEKDGDGFRWHGHAPDQTVEARLAERAEILGGKGAGGSIELATGMPNAEWPGLVESGLGSLALMKTGRLEIEDQRLALSGSVSSFEDLTRLEATFDPSWLIEVTVLSPDPAPKLVLELPFEGQARAEGRLPRDFDLSIFPSVLPEIDTEAVESDAAGDAESWERLIDALAIISPRLREAKVAVTEGNLSLEGTVKREFEAPDTRAALNAALPEGWQAELIINDAPPLPSLTLTRDGGLALTGILPSGIKPSDALALTGAAEGREGVSADGEGDPDLWRRALGAIGRLAVAYRSGAIELTPGEARADGALAPGYLRGDVQVWMDRLLPDGWTAEIKGTELAAVEGDRRINLITVESERFLSGYWLPELRFEPDPTTCDTEARAALSAEKITFVTGSSRIDAKARALVNRLAAVALRCANEAGLKLDISGHTDNVGSEDQNQSLSERRAKAVLEALAARGVQSEAMSARGLGEAAPLASNDTEEGRAQNRRIDFHFTE